LIFFLAFSSSCEYVPCPIDKENKDTSWVSEDHKMFFLVVWESDGIYTTDVMLGFWVKDDEVVEFNFSDLGDNIEAYKVNIDSFTPLKERELFKGKFKYKSYKSKKFTITITKTNVESIKIGDKITFNRVDELPDWAAEVLKNWENESSANAEDGAS
jgi:hypothetical protein